MKHERIIKKMRVSYKPGSTHLGRIPVSSIRITNNLLKEYGFEYQSEFMVMYESGKITLLTLKEFHKHHEQS